MICPTLECGTHFVGVFGALVNASNATAMSAVMVQDRFNVVGLHA
jgi:hypothetical protein